MIKKIFFGHYPQTVVTDETLIRKLDEYSEFEISFNGRKYVKILRTADNISYHYFKKKYFLNREGKVYYRDTKLLAIKRVLEGKESIRSVALDLGLTDPTIYKTG